MTSYLHNPLIHQLSRDVGRYSPRTRFAEMFLNTSGGIVSFISPASGNYFGLYTVKEKIKQGKARVDIAKLEVQNTNAPDVTGGYLLKIDRSDPNERTFYDPYLQGSIVYQDPSGLEMVDPGVERPGKLYSKLFLSIRRGLIWAQFTPIQ